MNKRIIIGLTFLVLFSQNVFSSQNTINVLTDRSDFHMNTIVSNFEKETGNKVNIHFIKKGIVEKSKSGTFDIIISKDSSEVVAANSENLLKPIPNTVLENIPEDFKDTKHNSWFLMSYRIRAFHVSKKINDIPLTYNDLAKPQYKGRICIRNLTDNYNLELFGTMLYDMGDEKFNVWFKSFKSNLAREPAGNDRNQVQAVYQGICDIAIANTYYRGLMLDSHEQKPWADATNLYIPDQGRNDTGSVALFAGVGQLTNNPINITFMKYLISDSVQKGLSKFNYEYTINPMNSSTSTQLYGREQGLNYKNIKMHSNIQYKLPELKKRVYFIIKNN